MNADPPAAAPKPYPFLPAAIGFIAGIAASEIRGPAAPLERTLALVLAVFLCAALLAGRRFARTPFIISICLTGVALAAGFAHHQSRLVLPSNHIAHYLHDEPILTRIAGQVISTPVPRPSEKRNPYLPFDPPARVQFVLAASELLTTTRPEPIAGHIRVTVDTDQAALHLGDTLVLTGWLYRPRGPRNPGERDWARLQRLQGIHAGLSVPGAEYVVRRDEHRSSLHRFVGVIRAYAKGLLLTPDAAEPADESRLLNTMILGQRSAAGRRLNEAFQRTGTIHFLTVSGFHVGILAMATFWVVRNVLRQRMAFAAVLTIAVIVSYAVVAEPNAPILRASIMGILGCLALLTGRRFCALNWLALSAICVLLLNPLDLFRAGFQLSFIQVLTLVTIVPRVYFCIRRRDDSAIPRDPESLAAIVARGAARWLIGLAIVCCVAWFVSLPLVAYHFGRFAPFGALQAIALSPLIVANILVAFVTMLLGALAPPLHAPLQSLLQGLTGRLISAVEVCGDFPLALVELAPPPVQFVAFHYLLIVLFANAWAWRVARRRESAEAGPLRAPGMLSWAWLVSLVVMWAAWWLAPARASRGQFELHVLAVGNGNAALLTTPDGEAAFIDVGTIANFDAGRAAADALRALGIDSLAAIVVSHANFDHFSGVHSLAVGFGPTRLLSSGYFERERTSSQSVARFFQLFSKDRLELETIHAGDRFDVGEATVRVLWPPADLDATWKPNDRSLVLRVEAHGRRILIPGDIERDAIRALLAARRDGSVDLRADVLVAPHHGAVLGGDTEDFYRAVDPRVVIVSTAKPRPKLADLVHATLRPGCRLVSTRDAGAVTVGIGPDGEIRTETPFAPP